MKTSIFNILSIVACLFGVMVAATPIDMDSLVARDTDSLIARDDSAGKPIIDVLLKLQVDIDIINNKWKKTCDYSCTSDDIVKWQNECAKTITAAANDCKGKIPKDFVWHDHSIIVKIIAEILIAITVILKFLLGKCGLLGGIIGIIVVQLCISLSVALKLLISILTVCVPGLLTLVLAVVASLLGGVSCLVCSLL